MSKVLRVTILLAFAIGLFGAYRHIAAQEAGSSTGRVRFTPPKFDVQISQDPKALATKHALQGSYNNNGDYSTSVAASTYTPIDSQLTVACPGTSGTCTIQADMWIGNGNANFSGNVNAICLYVDGSPASADCNFVTGVTPSDFSFLNASTSQGVSGVPHGNHTVQTYFFSEHGADVGYYNTNYRVCKP